MPNPENSNFDALADAIVQRLSQRSPGGLRPIGVPTPGIPGSGGPFGEIDPERPNLPFDGPHNSGADALPRARLGIAGMELTQSIQYSGAAGTTFGDDNSVPLVALKTLVARVYPVAHAGLFSDSLTGSRVTGELILAHGDRVAYRTGPTRAEGGRVGPQQSLDRTLWDEDFSGLVPSSSLAALRRFVLNSSLNFIVPAYYCRGSRTTISVRLWRADDGPMSSYRATTSSVVTFLAVPAPRVSLVRVNWTDGAGNVTKPSDASMLATTSLAERMLPFPYLETTILGLEENRSGAFAAPSAASGGCNPAWQSLLSSLAVTKIFTALFGLGDIVFGMVPNAVVPAAGGSVNSGCSIGSAGCIIGFNTSFAHELGHQYGRPHVAVAGDASSDANYPNYGGDTKSIGEVGIDTGTSPPTLFDPATSDDLMSYGQNQWISPYTYQKILDGWDSHAFVSADPQHVRSILVVGIRLHRGVRDTRRVEIRQAHLVTAVGPPPKHIGATMSPLSIDLLDGSGKILATHHCFYVPAHGGSCGCGCSAEMVSPEREPYLDMHEAIELPGDEVAALSFHRGGEPFARLEAGGAPRVEIAGPERRDGSLAVQLQTQAPLPPENSGDGSTSAPVSVVVLFSGHDGATWQPVTFDPPNGEVPVDADRLPGGERCRFRAIATAGLRAAHADTEPFELAPCRRKLHLDLPGDSCGIKPGPVALRAFVDSRGRGAPAPQEIRWTSSLDGELGFGRELVAQLGEGRHEITATAPDGIGGSLAERGIIIVSGKPQRPEVR
jgi:hypothetical protein